MVDERGVPPPSTGFFSTSTLSKWKGAGLLAGLAAVVGFSVWRGMGPQEEQTPPPAIASGGAPPNLMERVSQVLNTLPATVPQQQMVTTPPAVPPGPTFQTTPTSPPTKPPRMASYGVQAAPAPAAPVQAAEAPGGQPATTTVAFRGQAIVGGRAGRAMDTSLMLMPGLYGCILDVAISSERSGPFFCHTSKEILSPAGVPLMPEGTRIVGQITGGESVRPGQSRIPALMATAYTPEGIPVPLTAVVTDDLGRVGMDGRVNRHFWERFGGAAMLLMSQGALDAARAALQSSGSNTLNINTGSVQGVAAQALGASINIPNTVEKNAGEAIAFALTAPVDFSDAIRLRVR